MKQIKCSAPWADQANCEYSAGDGKPNSKTILSRCLTDKFCAYQKTQVGTINLKPTPTAYAISLIAIIEGGNLESKEWAKTEIIKLVKAAATITPEEWAKEK